MVRATARHASARYKGRDHGIKPQRDYTLTDAEREAFEEGVLRDAELHARRLRGEAPYSLQEVKPVVSAAVIRSLVCMVRRLVASKALERVREIEAENRELRRRKAGGLEVERLREENAELRVLYERCRREAARWQLRMPAHREMERQPELPFGEAG